jgi:hypothetical protein
MLNMEILLWMPCIQLNCGVVKEKTEPGQASLTISPFAVNHQP